MSKIILQASGAVRQIETDGLDLEEILSEALGYTPVPNQVRVNGTEFVGSLSGCDVDDGDLITVMDAAVASKGVAGA